MVNNLPMGFIPIKYEWKGTRRVYLMTKTLDIYTATVAHSEVGDGVIGWRIPALDPDFPPIPHYKSTSEYDLNDENADFKLVNGVIEKMKFDFLSGSGISIPVYYLLENLLEANIENRDIFKRYLSEE